MKGFLRCVLTMHNSHDLVKIRMISQYMTVENISEKWLLEIYYIYYLPSISKDSVYGYSINPDVYLYFYKYAPVCFIEDV